MVTSAGTIPAKVVQVDAANDLALLKAANKEGRMKKAEKHPQISQMTQILLSA